MDRRRESSKQRRVAPGYSPGSSAAGGVGSSAADGDGSLAADGSVAAGGSLASALAEAAAAVQSVPEVPEVPHDRSADEQLDEMIAQMVPRSSPAVKSVVRTEKVVPGPEASLMVGLSPGQQGFLAQMADAMRQGQVDETGAPALAALGDVGGGVSVGRMVVVSWVPWLSRCNLWSLVLLVFLQLSLHILRVFLRHYTLDDMVVVIRKLYKWFLFRVVDQLKLLRLVGAHPTGGMSHGGAAHGGEVVVVSTEHHALTPSAKGLAKNPFWSGGAGQGSGGHPTPQRVQNEAGPVVAGDGSLSHRDLLELEALNVQMFQEVEAKIFEQMKERSQAGSQQGSASYHSASGGGAGIGPVSAASFPMSPPMGYGASVGGQAAVGGEEGSSPLEFGDWLAVVGPLMSDLSGTSGYW